MKKLLSIFMCLFALVCLFSCDLSGLQSGQKPNDCQHADEDLNHLCDNCNERIGNCMDANTDHMCDTCNAELSACEDANKDHKCDLCAEVLSECQDENQDLRCDYCKSRVECAHGDIDEDGYCNICFDWVKCMYHIDDDHDLVCDNDICNEAVPCENHADSDENNKCDWCNADYTCPFFPVHTDEDKNSYCDECLCKVEVFDFPWSSSNLTFEMSEHSNGQDLLSGCKNWMAGDVAGTASLAEQAAKERNEVAYAVTMIKVDYTYLPDNDSNYSWSKNYNRIYNDNMKGIYSDMYCNFVYDMVAASLLGCFANLKTEKYDNYFEFAGDANYGTVIGDSRGYMYEYMESLSIDPNKMYLVASDYFIDLIRATYCVPVNVSMLNALSEKDILGLGRPNTITDFVNAVEDGKWTYDLLMAYSAVCHKQNMTGFYIGNRSSVSASGLLYTSSVRLFSDVRNISGSEFIYDGTNSPYFYEEENPAFEAFAGALEKLVTSDGVNIENGSIWTYSTGSLFGGVTLLGKLEQDKYYQENGFLVVPVPLYTDYNAETGNVYNTQIANVGRIGAISVLSQKFDLCSAFLNYQSTHSESVLDAYYENVLLTFSKDAENAELLAANEKMLSFMRDSVRSGFDKAYEDVNALFNSGEIVATPDDGHFLFGNLKWHDILCRKDFRMSDLIRAYYNCLKPAKEACMKRLFENCYPMLPD